MDLPSKPTAIDLFCGAGGMSLGFSDAGFNVVGAIDIDKVHVATYKFNHPTTEVLCDDLRDVTGDDIKAGCKIYQPQIDLVFGGCPCQGFSIGGKRSLTDQRNNLLIHFARLITELKPKYFVLENVKGLLSLKYRGILKRFTQQLESCNYQIKYPIRSINAANYSIPQNRERVFIMGCQMGYKLPEYPTPLREKVTVWDAIASLPEIEDYPELLHQDWIYWQGRCYSGCLRTIHSPEVIARFAATLPGKREPVSRFLKLDPNGIANCLRAGTPTSNGGHTAPRPIHPYTPRCISVREAARLHSFPDSYEFHPTKWYGFRQIGNSVPPLMAHAIASQILKVL